MIKINKIFKKAIFHQGLRKSFPLRGWMIGIYSGREVGPDTMPKTGSLKLNGDMEFALNKHADVGFSFDLKKSISMPSLASRRTRLTYFRLYHAGKGYVISGTVGAIPGHCDLIVSTESLSTGMDFNLCQFGLKL